MSYLSCYDYRVILIRIRSFEVFFSEGDKRHGLWLLVHKVDSFQHSNVALTHWQWGYASLPEIVLMCLCNGWSLLLLRLLLLCWDSRHRSILKEWRERLSRLLLWRRLLSSRSILMYCLRYQLKLVPQSSHGGWCNPSWYALYSYSTSNVSYC